MLDPAASPVILLAFANDRDAYLHNLQRERADVFETLQARHDRGAIQVHKQEETTLDGLFKSLDRYGSRLAIFHYAGHASGTALRLEAEDGTTSANAIGLARRLAQLPALQLVFLNGCATHGQVATLLDAGVKAVIATSTAIDDFLASDFARRFYAALASEPGGTSIEAAFETASAYVASARNGQTLHRGSLNLARTTAPGLVWGLYANDSSLTFCLPIAAASPTDILIERISNGSISLAEARRLAEALGIERSAAATTPVLASVSQGFADAVTALATADDPADRAAAISVVRGDDAGAYDQLLAAAETSAEHAAAETASAAARFRQAGALAAPTSIDRAIAAYARATELDPTDSWTWIEMSRLYRRRGAAGDSRRCAERALDTARLDRDRGAASNELGELARLMGDLDAARRYFTIGLDLAKRIVAIEPENAEWLRNLSISHNRLGEVAALVKDIATAGAHFAQSLAIRENLAAADPDNTDALRDLSISHNKLGEIALANRNPVEARKFFTASLAIRERLTTIDTANTEWQRDLSVSHNKLGDLAHANADGDEARRRFTASLAIRQRLAAADPTNTDWQRDVSVSHNRLGDVAGASGEFDEAGRCFAASLAIRQRLAATDPTNADWQHDLSVSHERLGDLAVLVGNRAAAIHHYIASLAIARKLAAEWPDHRAYQADLATARRRLAELGGDPDAA